ncbi:LysR family transcriptional regulator [Acetobacteraceae bacterium H6797]|nr:LysR family transcriptional regulator [Acetobacteraceae bacterium H6797]
MRRFLPSLSALQAFEAAARHRSFTKAAEDLGLTQSGISRQIANLEQYLGLKLFERSGSRIVLTDAGLAYFEEVRGVLDALEESSIDLVRGRKVASSLMVGTHPTFAARWIAPRLRSFVEEHPEVPIEIRALDSDAALAEGGIDIAVLRGSGTWSDARVTELFPEELAVVASPRLIAPEEKPERLDFSAMPTLQNASRPSLWLQWLRASGQSHRGTIQGVRMPHSEPLIRAALSGLGLAVIPAHYVKEELARGELHMPFGPPVRTGLSYWIVNPERKFHRGQAQLFRNWLLREARKRAG